MITPVNIDISRSLPTGLESRAEREEGKSSVHRDRSGSAVHTASHDPEIELVSGLGASEIAQKLLLFHRRAEVSQRAAAFYLHELEASRGYLLLGYASTIHFAMRRMDLKKTAAYELLRAGKILSECEVLDQAFRMGRLSWSKVTLLCRVVEGQTQEAWVELARSLTVQELELEVRSSQRGEVPRKDRKGLPAVRVRITEEVDVLTRELWDTAKRKFEEETGESSTCGALIRFLANSYLKHGLGEPEKDGGSRRGKRSFHQVVVQQCSDCKSAEVFTEDGPLPVSSDLVERVLPEAEIVHLRDVPVYEVQKPEVQKPEAKKPEVENPEAKKPETKKPETQQIDRPTPSWMQKMVLSRDGHRCRSCHGKWELMVHHVEWRSHGGRTHPTNLLSLCGSCHGLVHEGLLFVEGNPEGEVVFRNAEGGRLDGFDAEVGLQFRIRKVVREGSNEPSSGGRDSFSGRPERSSREDVNSEKPRASMPPRFEDIPDVISLEWWRENRQFFTPNKDGGVPRYELQRL